MLAYELAVLKARRHMDSEEGKQYLVDQQLLMPGEWEAMQPGDRHSTVFHWIVTQLVRFGERPHSSPEYLNPLYVKMITEAVSATRGQANDLMSSIDRDLPISYSALAGMLVKINVLINSVWKGIDWSIWLHAAGDDLFTQPRWWVDLFVLLSWNVSYVALYDLGYMLYNPFGNRRIDVAHELIGSGIRKLSESLASGKMLPATMI
jgi:hypothetical protein